MDKGLYIFYIIGTFSVLAAGIAAYYIFSRYDTRRLSYWIMVPLIISSIYMFFAQYFNCRSLHLYVDFSCWAQLIYNIAMTGKPLCFIQEFLRPGTLNYLSAHFVPGVYILALPFRLWPYSETLAAMNFFLMASSIIPLYKLASGSNNDRQFGVFMVTALLWYPTFQYIVLYEFEMLRFSIPVILWMIYFFERRKTALYFAFVLLAVLVREEVGLTIMMFGLYLLFIKREIKTGLLTSIAGLAAFIIIVGVIMPGLRTGEDREHIAAYWFSDFGVTPLDVIKNMALQPWRVFATIIHPVKLANIFMLFLPLLFIPLLTLSVLIATLANLGLLLLSGTLIPISYMAYYVSPSIPFIFYAFIKGWHIFLDKMRYITPKRYPNVDLKSTAIMTAMSGLLVSNIFFGPSPIALQFWFKDIRPAPFNTRDFHRFVYRITEHHRKAEDFSRLIPDSAVVSAQYFLFPPLFKKKGTMGFPYLASPDGRIKADYVFFDKTNNGLKVTSPSYRTQRDFDVVEKDQKNWKLIKSEDGYFLYKRSGE